jgi:hypothetical protein
LDFHYPLKEGNESPTKKDRPEIVVENPTEKVKTFCPIKVFPLQKELFHEIQLI